MPLNAAFCTFLHPYCMFLRVRFRGASPTIEVVSETSRAGRPEGRGHGVVWPYAEKAKAGVPVGRGHSVLCPYAEEDKGIEEVRGVIIAVDPVIHYDPIPQRRSVRLKGFDYSQPGAYFVTVCTHEKRCCLGQIVRGEMKLNAIGAVVNECWLDIPRHFPNVELNTHIVMPNHVHGLFVIRPRMGEGRRERPCGTRAQHAVPLRANGVLPRLAAGVGSGDGAFIQGGGFDACAQNAAKGVVRFVAAGLLRERGSEA